MTTSTVDTLPQSPARLSRPTNFVTESTIFLDSLPKFRTSVNTLSSYINSICVNKYNMGRVDGVRAFPNIFQTLLNPPDTTQTSIPLTSDIDTIYSVVTQYSRNVNNMGTWFDEVVNEHGVIPYDLDKPMIRGVSIPMSRKQSRPDFNQASEMFSATVINNINDSYQSTYHTYISCCSNEGCGRVTDTTIIKIIDCGRVTDTTLDYI